MNSPTSRTSLPRSNAAVCRRAPLHRGCSVLHERLRANEHYLADLEVLRREEDHIVEQGGSPSELAFFARMGDLGRERIHG